MKNTTKIMRKGLYIFGLQTVVIVAGCGLIKYNVLFSMVVIPLIQVLSLVIWFNGYKVGWEMKKEVMEEEE